MQQHKACKCADLQLQQLPTQGKSTNPVDRASSEGHLPVYVCAGFLVAASIRTSCPSTR